MSVISFKIVDKSITLIIEDDGVGLLLIMEQSLK